MFVVKIKIRSIYRNRRIPRMIFYPRWNLNSGLYGLEAGKLKGDVFLDDYQFLVFIRVQFQYRM